MGSYNPGALNTLTGGTVRQAPCKDTRRDERRAELIYADLRGYVQEKRRIRDTDQGRESVLRRDLPLGPE